MRSCPDSSRNARGEGVSDEPLCNQRLANFYELHDNSYIIFIDAREVRMHAATLTEKFQIGIPKAFREAMHLKAGQQFVFIAKGDSIVMVPRRSMAEMRGLLAGASPDHVRDRTERY